MDVLAQLSSALKDRYVLDREIGRGGMATVYLARDVRHNRKVALKVLNPELGAVLGVERFLSEIQVTANLQHPNLLPLFDSGEAEGLLFYVMPFIEGESLRAKLQREKQLPIDEAVHIATSVASALDYAHRHGVIHRDLKPENILMHDGQPVVADFGIALAVSNAGGNRITQTGLSLGTPHYMSPEQATGDREIDGRTDVYSLGAVTYEMLVGEPPHDGKTSQAIIAKVLTDKPRSIRLARDTVSPHLEAAVDRALAKLPADRFHTAHEFANALAGKGMAAASPGAAATELSRHVGGRRYAAVRAAIPWLVAAAATGVAGATWRVSRAAGGDAVVRYEIPLPAVTALFAGASNLVAISRGGEFVAYVARGADGRQRLYLRAADDLVPREVPGSEGAAVPFFSPDSRWIAFWADGLFRKAPVTGGGAVQIGEHALAPATWSPSGWIVTVSSRGALERVPEAGGVFAPFTRVDSAQHESGQLYPVALPDGRTVLYTSFTMGGAAAARIGAASLRDGTSRILDVQGSFPLGFVDGRLVYTSAAGVVMAAPFDLSRAAITGASVALSDQAAVDATAGTSYAQMSPDGSLAYVSGVARRQVVFVGANGVARPLGEPGAYSWPRLSPDGRRLALTVGSLTRRDVWLYELPSGPFTQFTSGGDINDRPEWTPDGKRILFRSDRGPRHAIWSQPVDGSAPAAILYGRGDSEIDEGVLSPDGRFLVVQRDTTGNGEGWFRAMSGDTAARKFEPTLSAYGARFSHDGKWVVYTAGGAANQQVYARPFPSLNGRFQVSPDGGASPLWSPDGKRIFYTRGNELVAATIGSTNPFTIASREVVLSRGYTFNAVHADFDVAKDGRTIVALQSPSRDLQLVVVRNFAAELRARMAGTTR